MLVGIGLALALSLVASSTASAAAYGIALLPQSVPAGSQSTIRATISASASRVGSINLTPPEGYAVVGVRPPRGSKASIVRNVLRLRGLGIARGRSKVVTLTVNAPCSSSSTVAWGAIAKPSAGFRGRRLSPRGSHTRLTTRTTASCHVSFAPQPANVKVGERITGTSFDPTGPAVAVAVFDGAGLPSRSSGIRVEITLAPGSYAGPLAGAEQRSVNGVVTFPRLAVGSPGSYRLIASGKLIPPGVSDSFNAEQDAVMCREDAGCRASATEIGTFGADKTPYSLRIDITAPANPNAGRDGGALTTSFDTQPPLDCPGYAERGPDTAVFVGPNREKIVRYTLSTSLLAADPRTLQACVGLPYNFLGRLFTPFPEPQDTNGDGAADQFVGQLNDCLEIILGLLVRPPCVSERGVDANGDAFIEIRVPPNDQDPRYRS